MPAMQAGLKSPSATHIDVLALQVAAAVAKSSNAFLFTAEARRWSGRRNRHVATCGADCNLPGIFTTATLHFPSDIALKTHTCTRTHTQLPPHYISHVSAPNCMRPWSLMTTTASDESSTMAPAERSWAPAPSSSSSSLLQPQGDSTC